MKKTLFLTACIAAVMVSCTQNSGRWSEEKAGKWYAEQPWLTGCNYIPASAINQIEMWSADTFDPVQIDKELGWAEELGFNTMRVFLSSVVWANDSQGLKDRMEEFLSICDKHGIRPLFVFLDDCWSGESSYGKQPEPRPGIHNSGWVRDPSHDRRADTTVLYPELKAYMQDIIKTFGKDKRVLMWDLYNEPGNNGYGEASLPLVKKVFEWAREVNPSQPLSVGIWNSKLANMNKVQLELSDVINFHNYSNPEHLKEVIDSLKPYNRPLICTEYMARTRDSKFQNCMPVLKENNAAAINWGFVSGKTNTIFAWDTPLPELTEPEIWFHDIFRTDHTPFDPEEVETIKRLNGKQ